MSSAGHTRALQVAGAHHIAASASARPEAAEVPRRRPSERRKAPLPQGNFDPVFFLDFDPPLWYRGHFALFFAPQPGAQQRSDGQPRPQRNPHTPGATHACMRRTLSRTVLARAADGQHGEGDTRVRTPVRGTHARALAKRIATTSRASLASRVGSAAVVAAVRAAAPALAPLAARPRPAAPSAPEAPSVHVRREPTAAHSARPPGTLSGGERAGGGAGPRDGTGGGWKACARRD